MGRFERMGQPASDGPPKKIVVLGEELLAFRDTRAGTRVTVKGERPA
jgi:hypothetical protein